VKVVGTLTTDRLASSEKIFKTNCHQICVLNGMTLLSNVCTSTGFNFTQGDGSVIVKELFIGKCPSSVDP